MDRMAPKYVAMALMVAMIWGMGFVVAKAAMEHFPPILLMALRFTLTAAVMVWFVPIPRSTLGGLFAVSIIGAAVQYSLTFSGLKGLDAGTAALIVQLEVPFLVLLGAVLLNEKPTRRKWLGILVAFCGVGLIVGQTRLSGEWVSGLMVVGGAFTWAWGQVLVRGLKGIDGRTVTAWVAVFATPQLFLMSALFETGQTEALRVAGWGVWAAVAYLGLIMTALGYYFWNTLILRYEVGRVAPFLLLLPLFSVVGGALFLNEALSVLQLLGGAVVLFGVWLITIEPVRMRRIGA